MIKGHENGPILPLARIRFRFSGNPDARLPNFPGSAWRGAFGHRLREHACLTGASDCGGCLFKSRCSYAYLFETSPPVNTSKMRRYSQVPHPIVLDPAGWVDGEKGGPLFELRVILVGPAIGQLPLVARALEEAGEGGIGSNREPFRLVQMATETHPGCEEWREVTRESAPAVIPSLAKPAEPPPLPHDKCLRIRFETPLRVNRAGALVGPDQFGIGDLFAPVLRRISLLTYFHTNTPLETDFAGLVATAREQPLERADLRWRDQVRRSGRQGKKVPLGGLEGEVQVSLDRESPLWPYLWLGQWVHAGKGTVMGLGRYRIKGTPAKAPE